MKTTTLIFWFIFFVIVAKTGNIATAITIGFMVWFGWAIFKFLLRLIGCKC